jgi:hypothetical protein
MIKYLNANSGINVMIPRIFSLTKSAKILAMLDKNTAIFMPQIVNFVASQKILQTKVVE